MTTKRVVGALLTWMLLGPGDWTGARAEQTPVDALRAGKLPLTNAAAVRNLTLEASAGHLPVRLQAVVTFIFDPHSFFVQDESAGIYVGNGTEAPALAAGDVILLEGVSDPGDFAPLIRPLKVRLIGHTNLPPAAQVTFADLMTGRLDSQWVEVSGLVRTAYSDPAGEQLLDIDLGGGRVTAYVPNQPQAELMELVDKRVRVQGVCGTWYNKLRQLFGVRLMVPRWENLTIEKPSSSGVVADSAQSIGGLLRFTPQGSSGHRVKVIGTVVLQQLGRAFFLQDDKHGLYVETPQAGRLEPGDQVEVVGFPGKGEYTPVMQDAMWRKIGSGKEPSPEPIKPDEALSGLHDCCLVSIEGVLLDHTHNKLETMLVLAADDQIFSAHLPLTAPRRTVASLENNSRLRLTGVCRIEVGEDWRASPDWRAKSFHILMRSPADIQVLAWPSWWSLQRLLWIIGLLVAIVLASLLWASLLRLKVHQQTSIISQKLELEGRLKERYRDLFERANDMVYTHDLSGRITSINVAGEELLGQKRNHVIGNHLLDFIAEEQRPAARRWFEDIVDGKAPATVEWDFLTAKGDQVRLETSTRLIEHEGQEVEVEGIARNVTERHRLEKEILDVSTREQRRIGHDLHDGVCQQLAGIAVLTDILADKLAEQSRPEVGDAHKITKLINQATNQTRSVAHGLFPVRLEENGLVSALEELVENAGVLYQTRCEFSCPSPVALSDHSAAHHLYFIAQEAILNAVKHGKARLIQVRLEPAGSGGCTLIVQDNGRGLPDSLPPRPGMGIGIMKYRAKMIGADIVIQSLPGGGTEVVCQLIREPKPGEGVG